MRTTLATGTIPARVVTRRSEVDRAFRLSEEAWGRAVRGLARKSAKNDLDRMRQEWIEASKHANATLDKYEDYLRGWTE